MHWQQMFHWDDLNRNYLEMGTTWQEISRISRDHLKHQEIPLRDTLSKHSSLVSTTIKKWLCCLTTNYPFTESIVLLRMHKCTSVYNE
jgi:hypothetical protein